MLWPILSGQECKMYIWKRKITFEIRRLIDNLASSELKPNAVKIIKMHKIHFEIILIELVNCWNMTEVCFEFSAEMVSTIFLLQIEYTHYDKTKNWTILNGHKLKALKLQINFYRKNHSYIIPIFLMLRIKFQTKIHLKIICWSVYI